MAKYRVTMEVETPMVPNFLRLSDGQSVPLCAVTEDGLREIGKAWTEELIRRAQEQAEARKQEADRG